jgi:hypothetical protein
MVELAHFWGSTFLKIKHFKNIQILISYNEIKINIPVHLLQVLRQISSSALPAKAP